MKLYRPVLILSAEQAEALPIGTVTITPNEVGQVDQAAVRVRGGWHSTGFANEHGTPFLYPHLAVVGDTALVPIEAEEEWTAMGSDNGEPWIAHVGHDGIDGSREEAQQYVDRFGGFIAHRTRTPWEEAQ